MICVTPKFLICVGAFFITSNMSVYGMDSIQKNSDTTEWPVSHIRVLTPYKIPPFPSQKNNIWGKNIEYLTVDEVLTMCPIDIKTDKQTQALYQLGRMCELHTPINIEQAFDYYKQASLKNYHNALSNLGRCYLYAYGTRHNFTEAKICFEKAVSMQNSYAAVHLGRMHEIGLGVDVDDQKAFEYYKLSVELRNYRAIWNLAFMYRTGKGTDQNYQKAYDLYDSIRKNPLVLKTRQKQADSLCKKIENILNFKQIDIFQFFS